MSLRLKRILMALFGLLGAAALWPCLLALRSVQEAFQSYLIFSVIQGACLGLCFGAFFGSFEGIVVSSRPKAVSGFLFGALFGAAAGAAGAALGQLFLFSAGAAIWRSSSERNGMGLAVASGLAWAFIGLCLACVEGIRARSARKLLVGAAGGLSGGLMGGAALSTLSYLYPGRPLPLLAGLAAFGLCIALCYSAFENRFSLGTLVLLNGALAGKEYVVLNGETTIGADPDCDVVLPGYPGVLGRHASIRLSRGTLSVRAAGDGGRVLVNDEPPAGRALRPEDVIAVGKAKFIYGYFS